ncbi:MAG: rhodanese-like domain-containing protein [Cellvibrionaceae bacterium]
MDKTSAAKAGIKLTEVIIVNIEEAKRLYDLGAVFIDVRGDEEWGLGHIKGAQHVNFRKNFVKLKNLSGVDKDTPLVFYCASIECEAGPYASAVSIEWGFENVFYFRSGYFSWMLKDHPINMDTGVSTFAGETIQIRKARIRE